MKQIANAEAREYVNNQLPFTGHNLSGISDWDCYKVFSYGWYLIFLYKDGQWYENANTYSPTTAKHISQVRPDCDNITKIPYVELALK